MKQVLSVIILAATICAFGGCAEGEARPQSQEDMIKYSRQGYEALFTHGYLHEVEIVISQEEWDGLLRDMRDYARTDPDRRPRTGNYRKATFIYRGPAGDAIIEEVGFRTKGNLNRPYPQDYLGRIHRAHFKIKFNKIFDQFVGTPEYEERNQRRFAKQREMELRMNTYSAVSGAWDTSQMRELYAYELMRRAGVNASRTGSARLTITIGGEKHYFGVYTLIEPVDKSFLTKRYGSEANDGNLYKCLWSGGSGPASLEPLNKIADNPLIPDKRIIGVKDWERHYRPTYDLKTNTDIPDHTVLVDFIDNLNTLSGADLKEYLEANFEVDRFLRYLAMNVLIGKWDDYWADGNNYYLYFNNEGKIEYIPCDYDVCFGGGFQLFDVANVGIYEWGRRNRELLAVLAPQLPREMVDKYYNNHYPLVEKMFEIDEYRARYEQYLIEFITPANELFIFSEYEKKFNIISELYSPHLDNEMDEGEEMIIDEITKKYFYEKTLSIIGQLGLDEADYELPYYQESAVEQLPAAEELPGYEYPEELSFAPKEISNADYGFSFQHPGDWTDTTATALYEAIAPTRAAGLFVAVWNAAWASNLADILSIVFAEAPVEVLASGDTALADGTPAVIVEYKATIVSLPMHCYSIGVIKDGQWITINIWNIDQYATYDRDLFAEIAHTLQFN